MGTKGWHAICSTMLLNQIKTIHVQPKRHSMKITQQPVAIVTGASSGIGLGITQALLERGWRVVATSLAISKSKDLKPSPDLVLVDGEVGKKETAAAVVDAALKHFGRIDLLVNNAGIYIPKAFTDYTEEDYNLVMNTNVASFFYMTQQVIPQMKKQNSGHVVNISAVLADQPSGNAPALLAVLSKSPMPAVSKASALEYATNNILFHGSALSLHLSANSRTPHWRFLGAWAQTFRSIRAARLH